ncbi:MAG: hypothetical protein AAF563_17085 [Pseudomonadota bacterium]
MRGRAAAPLAAIAFVFLTVPSAAPALAYVGPGAGLTAIGTVLALVAALLLAIVGFVWYPIRRLRRRRHENQPPRLENDTRETP